MRRSRVRREGDTYSVGAKIIRDKGKIWGASRRLFWLVLLLSLAKGVGGAEEPQRVLLLHSFGAHFSPFNAFSSAFRVDLISRSRKPIDIYEASLETARFSSDQQDDPFVDYLTALVRARPPKLVVTIGGAATRFAQAHRSELFPSTPTLFTALDERVLKADSLTAKDAAVAVSLDLPAMIENILQVRPETKKVFVVIGSSPLERFWAQEAEEDFKPFKDRIAFEFSSSMSFDQIVSRVAALPPSTAILSGLMVVDAAGVPYEEDRVIARLHEAANAPLFGLFDSQLGKGIVGGPLLAIDDLASDAADASLRMLAGDAPADIRIPPRRPSAPTFDDRELARWGIPESRLPVESVALFREPTFYEAYRWQILGVLALLLIETIFVVALLEHRRRLRRTKQALSISEERLSTAAIAADVGLWVWDIQKNDIWVSESGRQLFGLGVEGTTFEHLVKVIHPDDRRPFWRAVGEALTQRGEFEPQFRLTVPGRGLRWVSSRGRVEFDSAGNPSRMRGVAVDITGRQAAEEEARELSGRLIHAHEDERARLARELHDDVTQRLAVLAINAGRGERRAESPADRAAMYEMREELVRLSEDVHSLSYRLHPSILEDLGLEEALRAECDRFAGLERTIIDLDTESSSTNISPDIALCLFRIAQEALRNVGRHASASRVRVSLIQKGDKLNLTIQDDGKGYNPLAVTGKASLGLASMRQRARLIGGTIEIKSATGAGTTVFASVPL